MQRGAAVFEPPLAIWRSAFLGGQPTSVALQRNGTRKLDLGAFGRCSYSQACAASGDFSLRACNDLRNFSVIDDRDHDKKGKAVSRRRDGEADGFAGLRRQCDHALA